MVLLPQRNCAGMLQQYRLLIVAILASAPVLSVGVLQPVSVQAETKFIPSVLFTETYDTNIFFSPPQFLPPGTKVADFGSTFGGRGEVLYKEREIEASLRGGGDVTVFAINTGLNYINTYLDGKAKLDSWLQRFVKGGQLRFAETFRYTPQSPSFLTGVNAGTVTDPFLRGIQTFRANTYAFTTEVQSVVPIYRDLAVDARGAFSFLKIGSILAATGTGAQYFNTNVFSASIGPRYNLTRIDSVILAYQPTFFSQTLTTGGPPIDTTTQTVKANYLRMGQNWTLDVGGGVTHVSLGGRAFAVGDLKITTDPDRVTAYRLDLSRRAAPSFFFVSGALISNVGQVAVSHKLSRLLTVEGNVNYGFNETFPVSSVKYTNFTAGARVNYKVTKILMLDLFYNYTDFKFQSPGLNYELPRNVVGFTLSAEWK